MKRVLAANKGWFRVKPGEKYTLSARLRADGEGLSAPLVAVNATDRPQKKVVQVSRDWKRYEFTFTPTQPFVFVAIGLDLEASGRDRGTLWLDAVQLEKGDRATPYEPREPVESFLECAGGRHVGSSLSSGLSFTVSAFNNTDKARELRGTTRVTDFFDRTVFTRETALALPPGSGASAELTGAGA